MIGPLHEILGITLSESCYSLNNLMASVGKDTQTGRRFWTSRNGWKKLEQDAKEGAAGPVVPKEPDPAVEVAAEAQVREGPGNQASRFPS